MTAGASRGIGRRFRRVSSIAFLDGLEAALDGMAGEEETDGFRLLYSVLVSSATVRLYPHDFQFIDEMFRRLYRRAGHSTRERHSAALDGLTVKELAHYDESIGRAFGLSGVFTVHAEVATENDDYSWDPFEITLTPAMTPFDILRLSATTLNAGGANCEFLTMDLDPDCRKVLLRMVALDCDSCRVEGWVCDGWIIVVCEECGHKACRTDGFTPMWKHGQSLTDEATDFCCDRCVAKARTRGHRSSDEIEEDPMEEGSTATRRQP